MVFTEVLGLYASEETEEKVYLRAWQDWDHHTLILTKSDHPGVEHVGWRVEKPEDLGARETSSRFGDRLPLDRGRRGSWAGRRPSLHDTGRDAFRTVLGARSLRRARGALSLPGCLAAQKFPSRGVAPRRFDHMNFLVDKPGDEQEWMTRELGIHHRYYVESEAGTGSPPGSRARTSRTRSRCNATATRTARSCTTRPTTSTRRTSCCGRPPSWPTTI